jgi:hypothetical protein
MIHSLFDFQAPEAIESELVGFLELFKHAGQAAGPLMAGAVASRWGMGAAFHAAAGVAFLLLLLGIHGLRHTGSS